MSILDKISQTSFSKYLNGQSFNVNVPFALKALLVEEVDGIERDEYLRSISADEPRLALSSVYDDLVSLLRELDGCYPVDEDVIGLIVDSIGKEINRVLEFEGGTSEEEKVDNAFFLLDKILDGFFKWLIEGKNEYKVAVLFMNRVFELVDFIGEEEIISYSKTFKKVYSFMYRLYWPIPSPENDAITSQQNRLLQRVKGLVEKLNDEHALNSIKKKYIDIQDESEFIKTFNLQEYKEFINDYEMEPFCRVMFHERNPILGIGVFLNELQSLGFSEEEFNPSSLSFVNLSNVLDKEFIDNSAIENKGILYKASLNPTYSNTKSITFCFELVTVKLKDSSFQTFITLTSSENLVDQSLNSAAKLNFERLSFNVGSKGYGLFKYTYPRKFDGFTSEQIKKGRHIRREKSPFIHWGFQKYSEHKDAVTLSDDDIAEIRSLSNANSYRSFALKESSTKSEQYERYFVPNSHSELRYVSSNKVKNQRDVIDFIFDRLKASDFISNEINISNDYPKRITGYPYLIRSFKLPSKDIACDVELDAEEIPEQFKLEIRREQQGTVKQTELNANMTQNDEVEVMLSVYTPDSGSAMYAYCDKDYWDDEGLWGETSGICFHPAIRFDHCTLIVSLLIKSGHKVMKGNSLAKNMKMLIEELESEYEIKLEFKRPANYYLALEDFEDQYNWIEDPIA